MSSLFERLRQRQVAHWGLTYLAGAWFAYEALSLVGQNFGWPPVLLRVAAALLGLGLAATLVLAWYHGEKGRQRVSGPELAMLAMLMVIGGGVVWLIGARPAPGGRPDGADQIVAPDLPAVSREPDRASLAVLPFDNFGGSPDDGFLSDGITEEIIAQLAQIDGLKVISRTSVEALKGSNLTIPQIADTLRVRHVLEGSVRRSNNRVRITVQLIEAKTDAHVWADSYEDDLTDLFGVQQDVAKRVATALLDQVAGLRAPGANSRTRHNQALEAHLRGKYLIHRRTRDALLGAMEAFESAIALDSSFAPAYAGLAAAHGLWVTYAYAGELDPYEALGRSVRLSSRAIELDSTLAEAYGARGYVMTKAFAPTEVVRADFERAMKLLPNSADLHGWYAHLLVREERFTEAIDEAERAIQLDPVAPGRRVGLGLDALAARRYDLALEGARGATQLEPALERPRATEALALLLLGRPEECAALELRNYAAVTAMCLDAMGRSREAGVLMDSVVMAQRSGDDPQYIAAYYAWIGDANRTVEWLEKAFRHSPDGLDFRIIQTGVFDRVRRNAKVSKAMERLHREVWERVQRESRRS